MKIKKGVSLQGLQLPMRIVLVEAEKLWITIGKRKKGVTVTSGTDGVHSAGSYHPFGFALDFRTRYFSIGLKLKIANRLRSVLKAISTYYDVEVEKDHIHVEYDIGRELFEKKPVYPHIPARRI